MNLSWFLEQSKLTQVYAGENLNKKMRLTINLSWESKTGFKPGILPSRDLGLSYTQFYLKPVYYGLLYIKLDLSFQSRIRIISQKNNILDIKQSLSLTGLGLQLPIYLENG